MRSPHRIAGPAVTAFALSWALTGCGSSGPSPTGAAVATTTTTTTTSIQHLDVAGFAGLVTAPSTVVIDVRTPEEFASGHLAGARDLDIRGSDFDSRLASLDKTATYAVYCHSGNRSGQALQRMAAAGFTHVADLSGGIIAWSAAGKTVTTN